jgi:hypothetical protein
MAETFGAHRAWTLRFSTGVFAAMNPKNRNALAQRVVKAAEAALAGQGYASSIDVLVGIGWLDSGKVEQWRRGQIDYLERAVQTNLPRISEAMKLFRSWAARRGLSASPTSYIARSPLRQTLRFSRSDDPTIEALYRTHWVSQELSQRKRQRLAEKASRAPELVVVQPLNREWKCHRCGKTGDLLMMEIPARHVWTASVSMVSSSCPLAMRCCRGMRRRKASDTLLSCASAERAAVMNDKACWSSLWPWRPRVEFRRLVNSA